MELLTKVELEGLLGQRVYDYKCTKEDISFALNMESFGYSFGGPGEEVTFNLDNQGRLFSESNCPGCETYCPSLIKNPIQLLNEIADMGDWLYGEDEELGESEAWPNEDEEEE